MSLGTVAIEALGCKLNQAETEAICRQFSKAGYTVVDSAMGPDIYILNTCTVTHIADRKCRHQLRLARRRNPQALVVATGCYAQRAPEELSHLQSVDFILGNEDKERLVEIVRQGEAPCSLPTRGDIADARRAPKTRALVKIQEGCSKCCSYCIVPQTRGKERSVPLDEVLHQVKARVAEGYLEIVLTGTDIGRYGRGGPGQSLRNLLERILREGGVKRLRLSSLQPQDLDGDFLRLWEDERMCPHLHLPLQSGSDAALERMRRRYTTADYERVITLARRLIPNLAVTSDVIVGFPGESEAEFEESYRFCERVEFARLHVFPYSPRPGTPAAGMEGQVRERVKRQRVSRMLGLAEASAQHFRERFLGRTAMVLWEKGNEGLWTGITDNYIRVFAKSNQDLGNKLLPAKLVGGSKDGLWGELIAEAEGE